MGTDIYLVRNGQLRGRWGNEDALGMMVQLGYVDPQGPPPPPANEPGGAGKSPDSAPSPSR
jgi:hypothetical protein